MRRFVLALAGLIAIGAAGEPGPLAARTAQKDCTDYCGERAAQRCERIDSWKCTWFILGCLSGCNISQL